jgi:cell division protein ZapA
MNKIKLTICGIDYTLSSDETDDYMTDLAGQIDREMQELLRSNDRLSTTMAAVLTALNNADMARKAIAATDNLRAQMKGYLDDNAHIRQEADAARREAEHLRAEVSLLKQKLAIADPAKGDR